MLKLQRARPFELNMKINISSEDLNKYNDEELYKHLLFYYGSLYDIQNYGLLESEIRIAINKAREGVLG